MRRRGSGGGERITDGWIGPRRLDRRRRGQTGCPAFCCYANRTEKERGSTTQAVVAGLAVGGGSRQGRWAMMVGWAVRGGRRKLPSSLLL